MQRASLFLYVTVIGKGLHSLNTHRKIVAASLTVSSLTVLVKLAGAAKLVVIAHHFGAADALDAFLIAFLLPSFLAEVIGSSFTAALVPALIEVRERAGPASARSLLSNALGMSMALLCGAAALVLAAGGPAVRLLASGFDPAKLALCQSLLRLMAPLVLLMGLSAIARGVLNAEERFALAASVPCITPLVTIALIWMLPGRFGAQILAGGALLGSTLEVLIVCWAARREGYRLLPRWPRREPALRQVLNQYAPMMAGALLTSGALLIDPAMAAALGPGSVSVLNYGTKVTSVLLAIGPAALATVALPHFSRMVALERSGEVSRALKTYSRWIVAASVPATLLLVWWSAPLVRLLFERGAFTHATTPAVAAVQKCALLQLPFALLSAPMARLVSSLKANQFLMWAAGINLVLNAGFDYLFMQWWGVAGIALSSTFVAVASCGFLAMVLRRRLTCK